MVSINSFLKGLSVGDNVRDYRHASRTFVDGNYRLTPKRKFLFHAVFQLNKDTGFKFAGGEDKEASFLVKSFELPKYRYNLTVNNQYNRKRHNYLNMEYDPISITFHDDSADVIRNMLYAYYAYYSNDPHYESSTIYRHRDIYDQQIENSLQWGLDRNTEQFFESIKIYSMYQNKFTEYWLVNPIIESFGHDRLDYADEGFMEHIMTLRFETVKYRDGFVNDEEPANFGSLHYDTAPSPLTPPGGGTESLLGPGGIFDTTGSIGADLARGDIASAAVTGLRNIDNLKGVNLKEFAEAEITGAAVSALRGKHSNVGNFTFPNKKQNLGNPLPHVPKGSPVGNGSVSSNGGTLAGATTQRVEGQVQSSSSATVSGNTGLVDAQRAVSSQNATSSVGTDLTTNPTGNRQAQIDLQRSIESGTIVGRRDGN